MPRITSAFVLALAVALAAGCSKEESPKGGAAAGSPSATPVPWRDGPSPDVREALERVPGLPGGVATILDLPALRTPRKGMPREREHAAAEWRRFLVSEMGLPDASLGLGVHVERKEEGTSWTYIEAARIPLEVVRAAAEKVELMAVSDGGRTDWKRREEDAPTLASWSGGWLVSAPRATRHEATEEERPAPRNAVLAEHPELTAALGGIPADALARGPVVVTWGKGVSPNAFGQVRPLAHVEWREVSPAGAGLVLVFPSPEARAEGKKKLLELYEDAKKRGMPAGSLALDEHGPHARMLVGPGEMKEDFTDGVRAELRTLLEGVRQFREQTGRFPTTEEGLAALGTHPRLLDDFLGMLPNDPWDQPYHYREPQPGAEEPDLRSRGPDREIDTEDDLFPAD